MVVVCVVRLVEWSTVRVTRLRRGMRSELAVPRMASERSTIGRASLCGVLAGLVKLA